jgi:L-ascorbate metabolism protein UlaG (beta-lactamase superfamily)
MYDPASPANFADLPSADLILITDTHRDHVDPVSVAAIGTPYIQILVPPDVVKTLSAARSISNREITQWDGWIIEAVPIYDKRRGPAPDSLHGENGRGNGYLLNYRSTTFYISGDTEVTPEMRSLKNIDVAFICMNPLAMSPEEAADAVKSFHPKIIYPFDYRGADPGIFARALEGTGIEVRLLD